MDFIFGNLTEIRDILWIVFTFIATIIAILTYRRARFTILQPLRVEVIKRQTELLVDLLDYLEDDTASLYEKIDYMGIIACNSYLLLKHYGFVLSNNSTESSVMENLSGILILKESGMLKSVELPQTFNYSNKQQHELDNSRQDYELAKKGVVDLELLHLTKQHHSCMNKLNSFIKNTYMPRELQSILKKICDDISYNLRYPLKQELEKFIIELCSNHKDINEENSIKIDHAAIYNFFQRKSKHSKEYIREIRKITREYLMIDKKWK